LTTFGRAGEVRVGVQVILERGAEQDARVVREDVLGAIAVVDVEVGDRDALEPVRFEGMRGCDGDVVEQAEAHRACALGVVAGWADGAERGADVATEDAVDSGDPGTRGGQSGVERIGAHRGVGVELHVASRGCDFVHVVDVCGRVDASQLGAGRWANRLDDLDGSFAGHLVDAAPNGIEPLGALGMAGTHVVAAARRGREDEDRVGAAGHVR
jgi:hypothetical protein